MALDPAPGQVFLVGPSHSFEQFAEAIDTAFARWDLSHLHTFELADGRPIRTMNSPQNWSGSIAAS
jgi:hypothetical protein